MEERERWVWKERADDEDGGDEVDELTVRMKRRSSGGKGVGADETSMAVRVFPFSDSF